MVVDFFATWCGPCKMLAPVLEQAADQIKDVTFYKVDIDEEQELTNQFKIMSVPTLCSSRTEIWLSRTAA